MFEYTKTLQDAKKEMQETIELLRNKGYHIFQKNQPLENGYAIDKYTIKSKKKAENVVVLSSGLHGIEGFIGHSMTILFLRKFLKEINERTEVILYHIINPFGMDHYQRTNHNNVDLNRNYVSDFTVLHNEAYETIQAIFKPKPLSNLIKENALFYTTLTSAIAKHGASSLSNAILLGQNIDNNGLYYTGTTIEKENQYIIEEAKLIASASYKKTIWIDLHSGYGPKDQMSIINSKYEKELTKRLKENISYQAIIGSQDDMYESTGDIIEYLYGIFQTKKQWFYGTCFEFGTSGTSLINNLATLKALTFSNHIHFNPNNDKITKQVQEMMWRQFVPESEVWKIKASNDFFAATADLFTFFEMI